MGRLAIGFAVYVLLLRTGAVHGQGGFLGNLVSNVAQGALQALQQKQETLAQAASQPSMPSVAEQARIEAIQKAKMNQISATEAQAAAKDVMDTYKQLEQDLAMPLAEKTSHLKDERLKLMRRISTLTKEARAAYDALYPDMVNRPLIIVAKSPDDDMRAVANRIDAQGSLDELQGIMSPCAQFHNEREAEKKELQIVQSMNNLDEESRALSRMSPEERLTYDRNMAEEYGFKKEQLATNIKQAGKINRNTYPFEAINISPTERQAGIHRPTVLGTAVSGLLGGLLGAVPGVGASPITVGRV
ncbi:hypothetical protein TGPRC2_240530 [Toxoplasma gondii TgCatPRC2]|uniref:Transmembrane protein n=15 Tax=Toxoplasma gondii TaxID=5811 RepID=B9PNA0_TOXGV|nr:hypothetical protein TGME49_240530 [Toxoplasma gondii ME49]EPR60541.1 hypothetical protein TGGT1_240530 [Toxoplasma gondii GT1]ESS31443.1 hypothetical protein TGVEG_240530 [Toxoplasma gondii VEG]KAF4643395.1 hypothetical protein TGRH88_030610 [Toxoplasma gondii]KFG38812.1 hypothetical protein TGP89_240530 [Toxoplasma gondii p89]KFG39409.1 hypothetical protein TGDOM2_240530 [Toxoplasma gondii GAB2-2007-GAL-DOM2]KFG48650.1 hypothetical protein TGFOU_240530 [Toxoplasma gondii FOU]KFH04356.1 |eukprot:XP_002366672.1 hypothetical protein TGME49_240530 [Toxoplasma gondii ME49]